MICISSERPTSKVRDRFRNVESWALKVCLITLNMTLKNERPCVRRRLECSMLRSVVTQTHTDTHRHPRTRTDTHRNTQRHPRTHTDTHRNTRTHTDTHGHMRTHTNTQRHTRTRTDTRGHTRTHTDTHKQSDTYGHTDTHMVHGSHTHGYFAHTQTHTVCRFSNRNFAST